MHRSILLPTMIALIGSTPATLASTETAGGDDGYPSDQELRRMIERKLDQTPLVDIDPIGVSVEDHTVTLTGEVDSLMIKRQAERVAENVKGVHVVANELGVPLSGLADSVIADQIEEALIYDPAADSYEIDVSVERGVATLEGEVDSWQERQAAERIAAGVHGVGYVDMRLDIDYGDSRPDSEIAADVEFALRHDRRLDDDPLRVSVDDGTVQITGSVDSAAERKVLRARSWVSGVKELDLEGVTIDWQADAEERTGGSADDVEQAVRQQLRWRPFVDAETIEVDVDDGHAFLEGSVRTLHAKREARRTAAAVSGVDRITNLIRVRPELPRSESELAERIDKAFARDAIVNGFQVEAEVDGRTAILTGHVDNTYQRQHANELVAEIEGITQITNLLKIDDSSATYEPYFDYDYGYDAGTDYELPLHPDDDPPYESDLSIHEDIRDELYWSPYVDSEDITVEVEDGIATLSGEVDSYDEYLDARINAYEGGAWRVKSSDLEIGDDS